MTASIPSRTVRLSDMCGDVASAYTSAAHALDTAATARTVSHPRADAIAGDAHAAAAAAARAAKAELADDADAVSAAAAEADAAEARARNAMWSAGEDEGGEPA